MFHVELTYFKSLQTQCIQVVTEKLSFETKYKGKVKISAKQAEEFKSGYQEVDEVEISQVQQQIQNLLKSANDLKNDLEMVQVNESQGQGVQSKVLLVDEEEDDPDAKLFE